MTLMSFLAASGVLAWMYATWRLVILLRGAGKRLKWALWGYRHSPPRKQS
jgi:hypothetical protein